MANDKRDLSQYGREELLALLMETQEELLLKKRSLKETRHRLLYARKRLRTLQETVDFQRKRIVDLYRNQADVKA